MKTVRGGFPYIIAILSLVLIGMVQTVSASEGDNDEYLDLESEATVDEICSGVWMDNSVANRIEIEDYAPETPSCSDPNCCCRLTIHKVNDEGSNHLAYSFFIIADPHIGDVNDWEDYNCDGYAPDFNPGCGHYGSYPANHLTNAVNVINDYYLGKYLDGVEQKEPIFCIVDGDIANTAEKAEFQHAELMLDKMWMPWLPVMGNHDTWPEDDEECLKNDCYFEQVFSDKFALADHIFPGWDKQEWVQFQDNGGSVGLQNWAFNIGPNHHLGLDFCKRTCGGGGLSTGKIWDVTGGSYPWYKTHVEDLPDVHERLVITAHHPLDFGLTAGCRKQFGCTEAKKLVDVVADNESELAYWFGGHEQPSKCWGWGGDDHDDYWAVGQNNGQDTIMEVHFCSSTDRGCASGSDPWWYSVALVQVYSDFVCDYTLSHDTVLAATNQTVTFTSISEDYTSASINDWYWDFGDGETGSGIVTTHYYDVPGMYWTKHRVKNTNDDYAWMIRPVVVEHSPPWLWVNWVPYGTGTPGGPIEQDEEHCWWWAELHWNFNTQGWGFDSYLAYRQTPYKYWGVIGYDGFGFPIFGWVYNEGFYPFAKINQYTKKKVMDCRWPAFGIFPLPDDQHYYLEGDEGKWYVTANVHRQHNGILNYDTIFSNTIEKTAPECTGNQGCPEIYTYYDEYYDSTTQTTIYGYVSNNTLMPHSENSLHFGQSLTDAIVLKGFNPDAGYYCLNIVENDDEETYLDAGFMCIVDHDFGTEVFTTAGGEFRVSDNVTEATSVVDEGQVDRSDELRYLDDLALQTDENSYVTVTFPGSATGDRVLLVGTSIPIDDIAPAQRPKDYLFTCYKPDGQGGWDPIPGGTAFARRDPYTYAVDIPSDYGNTFRIECEGDSGYLNYVAIAEVADPGSWTSIVGTPVSAEKWVEYPPDVWNHSDVMQDVGMIDDDFVQLQQGQQLVFQADTTPVDTTRDRSFVVAVTGFYVPNYGSGGPQSGPPAGPEFMLQVQHATALSHDLLIQYLVPYPTQTKIAIYDIQGRMVDNLVDGEVTKGTHRMFWNGSDTQGRRVSAGIYFVKMNAEEFEDTRKLVIMK